MDKLLLLSLCFMVWMSTGQASSSSLNFSQESVTSTTSQYQQAVDYLTQADKTQLGLDLLRQLADADEVAAQLLLGRFYQTGYLVNTDVYSAQQWFMRAAQQGEVSGLYQLGASILHSAQPDLIELGLKSVQTAAAHDFYPAQYLLASWDAVNHSQLLPRKQAIKILTDAPEPEAKLRLAQLLLQMEQPYFDKLALHWLTQVDSVEARYLLSECYFKGIGTPIDYAKSYGILTTLSDYPKAQHRLAQLHNASQLAKVWLTQAAAANIPEAKAWLAATQPMTPYELAKDLYAKQGVANLQQAYAYLSLIDQLSPKEEALQMRIIEVLSFKELDKAEWLAKQLKRQYTLAVFSS